MKRKYYQLVHIGNENYAIDNLQIGATYCVIIQSKTLNKHTI